MTTMLTANLAALAQRHKDYEGLQEEGERLLEQMRSALVGRRVESGVGKLRGQYEITDVSLAYDFEINARGRKVTGNGSLGHQRWDLGTINARRLKL